MRKTLLITFTLFQPSFNQNRLIEKIKSDGFWAKLGETVYLIKTQRTPIEVRDDLQTVLTQNDRLFVCVAPPPSAWYNLDNEVSKWILDNQA